MALVGADEPVGGGGGGGRGGGGEAGVELYGEALLAVVADGGEDVVEGYFEGLEAVPLQLGGGQLMCLIL